MYIGKELEGSHQGDFLFHSSVVVPRPKFVGRLWTEAPGLILWHFSSFYALFFIGVGLP